MIKRIEKWYRTNEDEENILNPNYKKRVYDSDEETDSEKEDDTIIKKRIAKITRAAKKSLFRNVFDLRNKRKKLIFFDIVHNFKKGLENPPKYDSDGDDSSDEDRELEDSDDDY